MWNRRDENKLTLPVFYLYRRVLFPHCTLDVKVSPALAGRLSESAEMVVIPLRYMAGLAFTRGVMGTRARVDSLREDGTEFRLQFKGLSRVKVKKVRSLRDAVFTELENGPETVDPERHEMLRRKAQELIFLVNVDSSDRLIKLLGFISSLRQFSDFVANYFVLAYSRRKKLLNTVDPGKRADRLMTMLESIIRDLKKKKGLAR
jgi:ATP-dependent Lon protease